MYWLIIKLYCNANWRVSNLIHHNLSNIHISRVEKISMPNFIIKLKYKNLIKAVNFIIVEIIQTINHWAFDMNGWFDLK